MLRWSYQRPSLGVLRCKDTAYFLNSKYFYNIFSDAFFATFHPIIQKSSLYLLYMKKTFCRTLILSIISTAAIACSRQTPAATLASADEALSINDYLSAQSLCDNLADLVRNDSLALAPTQYCRLAMIYMTLAGHPSGTSVSADDNVNTATSLFNNALAMSADSVRYFLDGLAPEESGLAELLLQLSEATEMRRMTPGENEPTDSTDITDHAHYDLLEHED